jgi:hypothetical protein
MYTYSILIQLAEIALHSKLFSTVYYVDQLHGYKNVSKEDYNTVICTGDVTFLLHYCTVLSFYVSTITLVGSPLPLRLACNLRASVEYTELTSVKI